MRVLELYCGIGGCAAALAPAIRAGAATITAAVDVNRLALEVYARNFSHPVVAATVESLAEERWREADLWWMSPPCQPFTRRGLGRDLDDPRAHSFVTLAARLERWRPAYVGLENVPPFAASRAHALILGALERAGYGAIEERVLCPTELGVPNRRRRYYLVAARRRLLPPVEPRPADSSLNAYLDPDPAPELRLEPRLHARYAGALDVVRAGEPDAVAGCFTAAYGRSPVRSGSYLDDGAGPRRFSPREVLRLLGFPESFELGLPPAKAWRLVGNSLSVVAVRAMLGSIPELAGVGSISQRSASARDARSPDSVRP